MVDNYFIVSIDNLNLPPKLLQSVKNSTTSALHKVLNQIREDFSITCKKYSRKSSPVTDQIDSQTEVSEDEDNQKNYPLKITNKALVAKLAKERTEREKKRLEREEKARIKMQEEIEEYEKKKFEEIMLKEEEKRKRVEELLYKKDQRKRQIEYLKEIGEKEFREVITSKPLYVKIEENYEEQVLMPELEKKKAELAKKREFFQPIKKQEIAEHMKKYQENSLENQMRREIHNKNKQIEFKYNNSAYIIKSKFTENILEEEKKKKEEKEQQEQGKKKLLEKKKNYSSVVKEMFAPSIDEFKRQEMLLIQEKLKHPVRITLNENKSISDDGDKPRPKWKKNNLVPEKPPKREGKIVDYLALKRKERENSVDIERRNIEWESLIHDTTIDNQTKVKKLFKKAEILENESKKIERNIKSVNSRDNNSMTFAHESDNLLLNSIRAKLAILNANT